MSRCRSILALLDTFVDGELSPDKMLEVEQHLSECRRCMAFARFGSALKATVKRVVEESHHPSAAFEARVLAALEAERGRSEGSLEHDRLRFLPWRTILPVAAAAAATLVWAASSNTPQSDVAVAGPQVIGGSLVDVDRLIDELLKHHTEPDEPVVVEQDLVAMNDLERQLGVPLRVPSLQQYGARWEGASVVPLQGAPSYVAGTSRPSRAALLRYRMGSHRLTVYVYDASRVPLRNTLEAKVVDNVPIYVGKRHGYTIAAAEKPRDVGYAVATDLDDRATAELVAMTFH